MSLYKYTGEDNPFFAKGDIYDIDSAGDYHTTIDDKCDEHEISPEFLSSHFVSASTKAEAKPIYTQAMADNGELPSVGMEYLCEDGQSNECITNYEGFAIGILTEHPPVMGLLNLTQTERGNCIEVLTQFQKLKVATSLSVRGAWAKMRSTDGLGKRNLRSIKKDMKP